MVTSNKIKNYSSLSGRLSKLLTVLAISITFLILNGCSIMGLAIGEAADASKPDRYTLSQGQVRSLEKGKKLELLLRNGEKKSGKFFRIVRTPEQQYARIYSLARKQISNLTSLPNLGEQLTIIQNSNTPVICNLIGVDFNYLEINVDYQTDPTKVYLDSVASIVTFDGNTIDGTIIRDLVANGEISSFSIIQLDEKIGTTTTTISSIALHDISKIEMHSTKKGKFVGFGMGLIIDIVIVSISRIRDWYN